MLIGYTVLLPAGVGLLLGICGVIVSRKREPGFTEHVLEMILFFFSGLLVAASLLIDPHLAPQLDWFRTLSLFGVNFMLAIAIWSGMLTWYEALKKETFEASSSYVRTPAAVWAFGFSLPLFSLSGLRIGGLGFIVLGAAGIVIWKMGTAGRKVAPVLAGVAAALLGAQIAGWIGGWSNLQFMGVGIILAVIAIFGLLTYYTVWVGKDYHHIRGPVYAFILVTAVGVAIGTPFYSLVNHGATSGVSTASKVTKAGDTGNPFDPIARKIAAAIESRASHS
jgi:hypothetical protein